MKKSFALLLCSVLLLSTSFDSKKDRYRWGANGHRITAQIAEWNISDNTKKKIKDIAGGHSLAYLATWPDDVRSDKSWGFMSSLHFISVDDTETLDRVLARTREAEFPTNVVEAIDFFFSILRGNKDKKAIFEAKIPKKDHWNGLDSVEEIALAYLVHFSGDIHQPMHVGRTYDLGGNKIPVLFFGANSNLHSVWDSGIIEKQDLSYTEYSEFLNHAPADSIKAWQFNSVDQWARESIAVRLQIYKATYANTDFETKLPSLSYAYNFEMKPILDRRLLQGGIRLGGFLNLIFD